MGNTQAAPFRIRDYPEDMRRAVLDGAAPGLAAIAAKLRSDSVKQVVVLTGAGISVAAGVPDFRSPGTGLYDNLVKYNLPHPTSIFDLSYFKRDPRPFFQLARELYPAHAIVPTHAHYFLRLLHAKGKLRRVYTQNIDMLERVAGVPKELLVEAHGSFATSTCTGCLARYDSEWLERRLFGHTVVVPPEGATGAAGQTASTSPAQASALPLQHEKQDVPTCDVCASVVKPDITFFGETLPDRYARLVGGDTQAADLLLVMGTSLQVYPVASIPSMVGAYTPRVLINREAVGAAPPPPPPRAPRLSAGGGAPGGGAGKGSPSKVARALTSGGSNAAAGAGRARSGTAGSTTTDGGVIPPLPSDAEDEFLAEAIREHMRLEEEEEGHSTAGRAGKGGEGDEEHGPLFRPDFHPDSDQEEEQLAVAVAASGRGRRADDAAEAEEEEDEDDEARDLSGHGSWGFRFGWPDNYRDVLVQGDIEEGVRSLAAELGWQEELQSLVESERKVLLEGRRRAAGGSDEGGGEGGAAGGGKAGPASPAKGSGQGQGQGSLLLAQADAAVAGSPLPMPVVDMRPHPLPGGSTGAAAAASVIPARAGPAAVAAHDGHVSAAAAEDPASAVSPNARAEVAISLASILAAAAPASSVTTSGSAAAAAGGGARGEPVGAEAGAPTGTATAATGAAVHAAVARAGFGVLDDALEGW